MQGRNKLSGKYLYSKTNEMHQCLKFVLFWNGTLHVSDGLFVHHQEFKTIYTATGVCQTDTAVCLLAETRWNCCCMYSLELLMVEGKTIRNVYMCHSKINKFETLVHLVGFTIEVYNDARSYERQIAGKYSYAGSRILTEGNVKNQFMLERS